VITFLPKETGGKADAERELSGKLLAGSGFRVARNPSSVDTKRGDHFLQAELSLLINERPMKLKRLR
jgi:hypothetical protein